MNYRICCNDLSFWDAVPVSNKKRPIVETFRRSKAYETTSLGAHDICAGDARTNQPPLLDYRAIS